MIHLCKPGSSHVHIAGKNGLPLCGAWQGRQRTGLVTTRERPTCEKCKVAAGLKWAGREKEVRLWPGIHLVVTGQKIVAGKVTSVRRTTIGGRAVVTVTIGEGGAMTQI